MAAQQPPTSAPAADEHGERVRARGLRMTEPRRRVLAALGLLGHATPDQLAGALADDGGAALALSTVYRNLEALAAAGIVAHTHLDHGPPSYHLLEHGAHLHLVCRHCGEVTEADVEHAAALVGNLAAAQGFDADVTHMAIHGTCARCREAGR